MNLVEVIKNQLFSSGNIDQLSSLIGAGEGATKSAVGAAAPAVLAALSKLASSEDGAQKLSSVLGRIDPGSLGNMNNMLSGQAHSILEQGSGLLSSLFGGNTVSGLVSALAKYSGLGGAAVQKLLGYLMPMVLGGIASKFAGKPTTPQAVSSMFADQKSNIASAMPSGFSLNGIPGLATVESAGRNAMNATANAGSALPSWILPVALLAAIGIGVWWFTDRGRSPVLNIPAGDITKVTTGLTADCKSLTDTMTGIKDAASAAAAVPKLAELSSKLDGIKATIEKLPAAEKDKVADLIKPSLEKVEGQFAALQWIPGVGDKIQPAVDGVIGKLASIGGLPAPQLPKVNGELANAVKSLTSALTGIKDAATAEAALPKLTEISDKLDGAKATMDKLSDTGKTTIAALLKVALEKLKGLTDTVLAQAGVSDKIKPVLDGITSKLTALVG